MTESEIIRALKENEKAFGLMDKELQDWAEKAKKTEFDYFSSYGKWVRSVGGKFAEQLTYRLCPNYEEAPERIELKISMTSDGFWLFLEGHPDVDYTSAPALCPKEGYRFVGYKYENQPLLRADTVVYQDKNSPQIYTANMDRTKILFPIAVVYEKEPL